MKKITFFFCVFMVAIATQSIAQATLSIQGVIKNSDGSAVDNGNYSLTFSLYNSDSGGSAIWSETQNNVPVTGGIYSALLGESEELTAAFDETYFLGVSIDGGTELTPRARLTSSPYALALIGKSNKFASEGNVGIGTLDADEKLHVVGKGKFTEGLDVEGDVNITVTDGSITDATLTNATLSGDTEASGKFNFEHGGNLTLSDADFTISEGNFSVAIDANEIQARNNEDESTLHLNGYGGQVMVNQKQVPVGEENLRIIRGRINGDGVKLNGSGFTCSKTSTGHYEINFGTSFNDIPAVTFGPISANRGVAAYSTSTSSAKVNTWKTHTSSIEYTNETFSFIAIGSR